MFFSLADWVCMLSYPTPTWPITFNLPVKLSKKLTNQTPWQEISRSNVGQLEDGACIMSRDQYLDITKTKGILRNSH